MGALPATLFALAALITSIRNHNNINDLGIKVDGRLSQLLEVTKVSSKAEGVKEEVDRSKDKMNGN